MITRHLSVFFVLLYFLFEIANSDWAAGKRAPPQAKSQQIPTKIEPIVTLLYKNTYTHTHKSNS